jgi:hypothetical protein
MNRYENNTIEHADVDVSREKRSLKGYDERLSC